VIQTFLMHPAFLVGVGGAAGANVRFWLGSWLRSLAGVHHFPFATLVINVTGSILLGVIAALFKDRAGPAFLLLGIGFCGGFTTFSTFSLEVTECLRDGRWDMAGLYVLSSVLAGFLGFSGTYLLVRGA